MYSREDSSSGESGREAFGLWGTVMFWPGRVSVSPTRWSDDGIGCAGANLVLVVPAYPNRDLGAASGFSSTPRVEWCVRRHQLEVGHQR